MEEFKFDGSEMANVSSPIFMTKMVIEEYGVKRNGQQQKFKDFTLYPKEYFYPYNWKETFSDSCISKETIMIHKWEKKW